MTYPRCFWRCCMGLLLTAGPLVSAQETLESQLAKMPTHVLAKNAHVLGNPADGAILFFRQGLACTQCHTAGEGAKLLGPDLSLMRDRATFEHVIESMLHPSKQMASGYQAVKLLLESGEAVTGMVRKQDQNQIQLVVPGADQPRLIAVNEVEVQAEASSIMPVGLVNQLTDEQQFYDLISFLVELGQAGPERAASLRPDATLIAPPPLPAYEDNLDHRGLIGSWNRKSLRRGKELYASLCINCHGTKTAAGSLPNATRFATEKMVGGSDPLAMYKTLTHGYRMMLPQRQLVPEQKYDVIHYLREAYLNENRAIELEPIDESYLASLPRGELRGPEPSKSVPWQEMDYGPFLISSYEMVGPDTERRYGVTKSESRLAEQQGRPPNEYWPENTNISYKGIAIRLDPGNGGVASGSHWLTFDHDTMRVAGAWSGDGFIDWQGILFDGRHAVTPRTIGTQHFSNQAAPGWANPKTGSFEDPRILGRDGRHYGPLPRQWAHYKGLYKHGNRIVVSYTVGDAEILESHRVVFRRSETEIDAVVHWVRTLNVGASTDDLLLRVCPSDVMSVAVRGSESVAVLAVDGDTLVRIPAAATPVNLELLIFDPKDGRLSLPDVQLPAEDLEALTHGGDPQWPHAIRTSTALGTEDRPFAVDMLTRPVDNQWKSRLRMSGLDFYPDGDRLVACCCDGDVWEVSGISRSDGVLTWKRIASGLFHPLGLKIIEGRVFVSCRDQIVVLNDLNGDGETDFYESFNNDHQVTDHFHEFAMGLQTDEAGNLYYAKSARHARDSLVPHHGTLLRVSPDGRKTDIVANGFRAANGVCVNSDGTFFVTDQEGHWTPMNRINRVVEGGFYGNMYSYGAPQDNRDEAMLLPVCWPNKPFDRSPSELLWVDSKKWGSLNGALLNLSYGYGKIFVVPHEKVAEHWQGGMCQLPIRAFPTGIMRARFHPGNGRMYACGMHAWGSDQDASPGGLYRIRYTGKPCHLPVALNASQGKLSITFTEPLDPDWAKDPHHYIVETWSIRRSANYGSARHDERVLNITSVEVSSNGKRVSLVIPDIAPTWCMQVAYRLKGSRGRKFGGTIQNTIYTLDGLIRKGNHEERR